MPAQDLLLMILSHVPMRDAARAACVSHAFLHSWRCYPNLIFNAENLALNRKGVNDNETPVDFIAIVDNIMRNHSGVGVKIFKLELGPGYAVHPSHLDRWLKAASTLKIKEFAFELPLRNKTEYTFPYSHLLSDNRRGNSVELEKLEECAFELGGHYWGGIGMLHLQFFQFGEFGNLFLLQDWFPQDNKCAAKAQLSACAA